MPCLTARPRLTAMPCPATGLARVPCSVCCRCGEGGARATQAHRQAQRAVVSVSCIPSRSADVLREPPLQVPCMGARMGLHAYVPLVRRSVHAVGCSRKYSPALRGSRATSHACVSRMHDQGVPGCCRHACCAAMHQPGCLTYPGSVELHLQHGIGMGRRAGRVVRTRSGMPRSLPVAAAGAGRAFVNAVTCMQSYIQRMSCIVTLGCAEEPRSLFARATAGSLRAAACCRSVARKPASVFRHWHAATLRCASCAY